MTHPATALSTAQLISPIFVGLIWIGAFSVMKEPLRQRLSAIMIAGAGAAYLSGGLGIWEFAACACFTFLAYRGLTDYRFIGIGWFLHTCWDIVHHLYGNPIIPFAPSSSAGCAICDLVLAIWYFVGAPSVLHLFTRNRPSEAQL